MGVKLGTLDISAFKVGSGDCTVYLGTELIYSGNTPTPPTPTPTWVTYHSGDTVPTGVTFGGVRISENTAINDGAASFTLTNSSTYLEFGADFVCTNYVDDECTEWNDGYTISDDIEVLESDTFTFTDGYWTYEEDMQSFMYSPLPFDIELLS